MSSDRWLFAVLSCLLLCSCSVKEERDECPCCVMVCSGQDGTLEYALGSAEADVVRERLGQDDFSGEYWLEVERKVWTRRAFCGEGVRYGRGGWIVEYGEECPALYMSVRELDTRFDSVVDTVRLHKSFCELTIVLKGLAAYPGDGWVVEGDVCGYALDGKPLGGAFYRKVELEEGMTGRVRIPRQTAPTLLLRLGDTSVSLGRYIEQSGYDWNAEDLEDLTVIVDCIESRVEVSAQLWRKTLRFDIII